MRNIWHVTPHPGTEKWQVIKQGASRASSVHDTKAEAIREGKAIAKKPSNRPSQLIIHRKDGTIETEYTYDDDPYPPEG